MDRTPASLLERLRGSPSPECWGRFVSLYAPLIYGWARRAGLGEQDAADLVQEVLVSFLQTLPTFQYDRQQSFRRWLKAVTLNKWRDGCKRRAREPRPCDAELETVVAPDEDGAFWEAEYRQSIVARALQIAQADFQPTTWQAFWQHAVDGRPAADVAAELQMTTGAVYAARFRVLERLRQELAGMLD